MTQPEPMPPVEYRLRLQAAPASPDYWLLQYLKQDAHFTYSDKELVLSALRMCWLPLAYRHYADRLGLSHDELKRVGLDAVLRLQEQIQYITAVLDLELPPPAIAPTPSKPPKPMRSPQPSDPVPKASPSSPAVATTHTATSGTTHSTITTTTNDGYEVDLFGDD